MGKEQLPTRKNVSSRAFNPEYSPDRCDVELRDEIVSYLGEYRFQIQKYHYDLVYEEREDGWCLRDPYRKEAMLTKAQRAIDERGKKGDPIYREEAEKIGINTLDGLLSEATVGDTILWGSPLGPREEGYGSYGFIYGGEVTSDSLAGKQIKMTAFRVEHPTIKQYNRVFSFLTGRPYNFWQADQFLAEPTVVYGGIKPQFIERVIGNMFSTAKEPGQNELFQRAIQKLNPLINEFIAIRGFASKEEKLTAFYAIENYALELKQRLDSKRHGNTIYLDDYRDYYQLKEIMPEYGHEPPVVAGSCGSTGAANSNDILKNSYSSLMKFLFGEEDWFKCPKCHYKADGPIGNTCPGCGLTKEDYAQEEDVEICN